MPDRALTLRLDEQTYQALRKEAYEHEVTISSIIREAIYSRNGFEVRELAIRSNPAMPEEAALWKLVDDAGGWTPGLRSVWRHGCDAGMNATFVYKSQETTAS